MLNAIKLLVVMVSISIPSFCLAEGCDYFKWQIIDRRLRPVANSGSIIVGYTQSTPHKLAYWSPAGGYHERTDISVNPNEFSVSINTNQQVVYTNYTQSYFMKSLAHTPYQLPIPNGYTRALASKIGSDGTIVGTLKFPGTPPAELSIGAIWTNYDQEPSLFASEEGLEETIGISMDQYGTIIGTSYNHGHNYWEEYPFTLIDNSMAPIMSDGINQAQVLDIEYPLALVADYTTENFILRDLEEDQNVVIDPDLFPVALLGNDVFGYKFAGYNKVYRDRNGIETLLYSLLTPAPSYPFINLTDLISTDKESSAMVAKTTHSTPTYVFLTCH